MTATLSRKPDHAVARHELDERDTIGTGAYAALLGCSLATVYQAIDSGDVPVIRLGRVMRIPSSFVRHQLGLD